MQADIKENIVLFDWLTFTSKEHEPMELVERLGLEECEWLDGKGRYGYPYGLRFGHIGVFYGEREDMGVCVDMSGQGCREFETYSSLKGKWDDLFPFILNNKLNVTRLDVAFDDHTGLLDISKIWEDTGKMLWVSKFRRFIREESGTNGCAQVSKSITFGRRSSKALIRIYDKAAERGYTDGRHWIRCEIQLSADRAMAFLSYDAPLGEKFCGVVAHYLRFVTPSETDSNMRRWEMADYWENFLDGASRIRLASTPGEEYNEEKLRHAVFNMWGNAIACAMEIFGKESFWDLIKSRTCNPNNKYQILINKHNTRVEMLRKEAEERMNFEASLVEIEPGVFVHADSVDAWRKEHDAKIQERKKKQSIPEWVIDIETAPEHTWLPPLEVPAL